MPKGPALFADSAVVRPEGILAVDKMNRKTRRLNEGRSSGEKRESRQL